MKTYDPMPRQPKHATKIYVAKGRAVRSYRGVQELLFKNASRFSGSKSTPFEAQHDSRNIFPQTLKGVM